MTAFRRPVGRAAVGVLAIPVQLMAQWKVEISRDPMTDERRAIFSLPALPAESNILGIKDRSYLTIRCRSGKVEDAFVATPAFLSDNSDVVLRFDRNPALADRWNLSGDRSGLFAPEPADLISALIRSRSFRIAYRPYQKREGVATFAIGNLSSVRERLLRQCGEVASRTPFSERASAVRWVRPSSWAADTLSLPTWGRVSDMGVVLLRIDGTPMPYPPPVVVEAHPEAGAPIRISDDVQLPVGRYRLMARIGETALAPYYPLAVAAADTAGRGARNRLIAMRQSALRARGLVEDDARFSDVRVVGETMCATVVPLRPRASTFRVLATESTLDVETETSDESFADSWRSTCDAPDGRRTASAGNGMGRTRCESSAGDQPFFVFQVEKPAMAAPGSAQPRYPDILRSAGVEGEALVQFVVDEGGQADVNTFKVLRTTHELFAATVRNTLPNMRFIPAQVGGCKVKQLVQQPFAFAIQK